MTQQLIYYIQLNPFLFAEMFVDFIGDDFKA